MRVNIIHILFFIFNLVNASNSTAQDLPRGFSDAERTTYRTYYGKINTNNARLETQSAPNFIPRAMAEWEELQGVIITWSSYKGMLRDIVKALQNECNIYIVTTDSNDVKSNLTSNGVSLHNVKYIIANYNSVWVRDYGPNSVYANNVDSLVMVDWIYNRPRPKDDSISLKVGQQLGISLFQTTQYPSNLVHTGGNFMTDGFGTAFSSELVNTDNSTIAGYGVDKTPAEIDTVMKHFMGINRYIKMPVLPYDEIHHIDMHIKLLDEETLLVGQYPEGVSDGPQIEANLKYIQDNFTSVFGTPYKIIRIPMPVGSNNVYPSNNGTYFTYTNSLIANKTVIVPIYGLSTDSTALRIYRNAMPGYSIVGINSNASITSNGALHCITKEIGVNNPLLISYKKIADTYDTTSAIKLEAYIKHSTSIANAKLLYVISPDYNYTFVGMTSITGKVDYWEAAIPNPGKGNTIKYYVEATANTGKTITRPLAGSYGANNFSVLPLKTLTTGGINTTIGGENINSVTGIDNKIENKISIYPNPANDMVFVSHSYPENTQMTIQLTDLNGKIVLTEIVEGTDLIKIPVNQLSNGLYIINIMNNDKRTSNLLSVMSE